MKNYVQFFNVFLVLVFISSENLFAQSYQYFSDGTIIVSKDAHEDNLAGISSASESLVVKIKLARIPDSLTFSQAHVADFRVDYWWGVLFDADNDPATGLAGFEIEIALNHFKRPGEVPFKTTIIEGTSHQIIEWINDSTGTRGFVRHANVSAKIDPVDPNTLVMSAPKEWKEISNISMNDRFYVHTTYNSVNGTIVDGTGIATGAGIITDPVGDVPVDFVDIISGGWDFTTDIKAVDRGPVRFSLEQNFPNPFNPETTIRFDLPATSKVVLKIYNVSGHEVRTLIDEIQPAGQRSIVWDGKSQMGQLVSSGIYIYALQVNDEIHKRMMLLLK